MIDGNSDFTTTNGVVSGSGTSYDPYIIEKWSINASQECGISISGTNAHFIIRNCYIYDGLIGRKFYNMTIRNEGISIEYAKRTV